MSLFLPFVIVVARPSSTSLPLCIYKWLCSHVHVYNDVCMWLCVCVYV